MLTKGKWLRLIMRKCSRLCKCIPPGVISSEHFGDGEDDVGKFVVGEKFAEGGQAGLYHAQVKWRNPKENEYDLKHGFEWALKVFKKGTELRHLQSQWPQGFLQTYAERKEFEWMKPRYVANIVCGTLLEDGRFAFLVQKEQDLRSLIDRKMLETDHGCGPFPKEAAEGIMYSVALGMDWLHNYNIVHRDLKASNVLVSEDTDGEYQCFISDFEYSNGVLGTVFFRAPEIMQACKDRSIGRRPELFTKEADVYSYGMTCYEILTGKLPYEGHPVHDYDHVLKGERPEVPKYVDDWARELLSRCWQSNPKARPSFGEILNILSANSAAIRDNQLLEQQSEIASVKDNVCES